VSPSACQTPTRAGRAFDGAGSKLPDQLQELKLAIVEITIGDPNPAPVSEAQFPLAWEAMKSES
jgi:hypothetical protein